jgi:Holliday junction resolvase RusA-like endonuclease
MLVNTAMPLADEIDVLASKPGLRPAVYVIRVPGEIRGKGRPKFGGGRVYTDAKTLSAEAWVRHCAVQAVGQPMFDGPLDLAVEVTVAVPQSWPRKKREAAFSGSLRPTGKPDADNTLKLLADALNNVVWRDDAQLVDVRISKRYGDEPGAVLRIQAA